MLDGIIQLGPPLKPPRGNWDTNRMADDAIIVRWKINNSRDRHANTISVAVEWQLLWQCSSQWQEETTTGAPTTTTTTTTTIQQQPQRYCNNNMEMIPMRKNKGVDPPPMLPTIHGPDSSALLVGETPLKTCMILSIIFFFRKGCTLIDTSESSGSCLSLEIWEFG